MAIIDTPEFQRLRNLKQLGLAYKVRDSSRQAGTGTGHCCSALVHKQMPSSCPQVHDQRHLTRPGQHTQLPILRA